MTVLGSGRVLTFGFLLGLHGGNVNGGRGDVLLVCVGRVFGGRFHVGLLTRRRGPILLGGCFWHLECRMSRKLFEKFLSVSQCWMRESGKWDQVVYFSIAIRKLRSLTSHVSRLHVIVRGRPRPNMVWRSQRSESNAPRVVKKRHSGHQNSGQNAAILPQLTMPFLMGTATRTPCLSAYTPSICLHVHPQFVYMYTLNLSTCTPSIYLYIHPFFAGIISNSGSISQHFKGT